LGCFWVCFVYFQHQKGSLWCLEYFVLKKKWYEEKKPECVIFDARLGLKTFVLIPYFIDCEIGVNIEEYDRQYLNPLFLKCYHHYV
jgi:hypothetical protein